MKKIILFLFVINCSVGFSQSRNFIRPDYKEIEEAISNEKSDLYYPKLMKRYNEADSTMTLDESRHLYYGYTFQSGYSPYGSSKYTDSLRKVLDKDTAFNDDYMKVIRFSDSVLASDPFDTRIISYKLYAYRKLNNTIDFNKDKIKMNITIDAIMSSGNGVSKDSAFYVIKTTHEYNLLRVLDFRFGGKQSLIEHYDYLQLAENDSNIEGLYFDVSPCLNYMSRKLKK